MMIWNSLNVGSKKGEMKKVSNSFIFLVYWKISMCSHRNYKDILLRKWQNIEHT